MINLYDRLHRYQERWDEDFLTEALVHLLLYLRDHDDIAFANMISFLINEPTEIVRSFGHLNVESQFTIEGGRRPDICISGASIIVLIEVKVEMWLGSDQIQAYREFVDRQVNVEQRRLVTLTRYNERVKYPIVDYSITWTSVAEWLKNSFSSGDEVSTYLAKELFNFLNIRGVVMQKVEEVLVSGVEALNVFKQMLKSVLISLENLGEIGAEFRGTKEAGFAFYIRELSGERLKLWFGIDFEHPNELIAYLLDLNLDPSITPHRGEISNKYHNWWISQDLTSDAVQFFEKGKEKQFDFLANFVRTTVDDARRVYAKDQEFKLISQIEPM